MKRLFKRMLKAMWQKTAFVRRPIMRRIDNHLTPIIQQAIDTSMVRLETSLRTTLPRHEAIHGSTVYEVNLVLNSVVRELARLQMEVEALQQMVEESASRRSSLSIVGESNDHGRFSERGGEHAQVG